MNLRRALLWLHRWPGVLAGIVMLVIAVTGGALVFEQTIQHWLRPDLYPKTATPKQERASIQSTIQTLREKHPQSFVQDIRLPRDENDAPVRFTGPLAVQMPISQSTHELLSMDEVIQLAFPEAGSPAGRSEAFISQLDGHVLALHSSREGTLGEKCQRAQLSIHTGSIDGTATRWIAFLTCLALVLQIISGYVLWWKRPKTA